MGDPMKGIEEDVAFDDAAADALASACDSAAGTIEGQVGSRISWAQTALAEFKGHFSVLFASNADTGRLDATELVTALRDTAKGVRLLKQDAAAEQKRRNDARAWKKKHDDRGFGGWLDDTFGDGDDCPIPEATPTLKFAPPQPSPQPRQTPPPGSGGSGGGGTSSARPSDLHTFATNSAHANDALSTSPATVKTRYSHFVATCQWGTLHADGVVSAFTTWLDANVNDAQWAKVVGDAFAAAGGEGAVSTLPDSAIHAALAAAGVSESRKDLDIAMPSALGHPPTTGYANDPVNTSTGNFVETEVDLEFMAAAELWWRRSYNSVSTAVGAFGRGWTSWTEAGLRFTDEAAAFVMPDGRHVSFPRLGEGWDRATGENLWLTREQDDAGERLLVSGNDGTRWVFAPTGRLLEHVAGEGRGVRLTWSADQRLTALTHSRGRGLSLEWDGDLVVAVTASDGRRVTFDYDDDRLVAATGPLGTRRYGWNEDGLIASVTDADGVVEVDNVYDQHGRVTHQRSPFGRVTRFAYLPGRVTVVSDEDGGRANTWIADERGRLVAVIDAHDHRQSMSYDAHGNQVLSTDRTGAVSISQYDARGRQVREVSPSGADIAYAYDELDRVVRVEVAGADPMVDPDQDSVAVTTYEYAGEHRDPIAVTDPEGGVSRLEWTDGLLTRMSDPTGVSTRLAYDAFGGLVSTTDDLGNTARIERDDTGRAIAAVSPSGHRTSYTYHPETGLLAERVDPDGGTWRYEYTAGGRPTAVVDPTGGRTEVEYSAAGVEAATIDPLGRAVRRTYDDLGSVSGAELPDGSRWEFVHDALGRITDIVDPRGGTASTTYDADGSPSAVTDPTGLRREIASVGQATLELSGGAGSTRIDLDKLGRLVSETTPDGSTRLTRFDRCGRAVELVDAAGGLTRMVRDAAGRVVTLVRPSGGETSYTYDACGRLATITDETGATSTRTYDPDSRVVAQELPTGEVATTRYDECGRPVAVRLPGVGTSTYVYDALGRVVESRDPSNGRRRFGYDGAGQLVEAIDGNGGVTGYGYDAIGRCVEITHPDGGVTRREFDQNHRCTAETDPLGRTVRAEYDASGRQVAQIDATGSRTEWRYDEQGRLASTWVDGAQLSEIERDVAARRVRITDRSGPGGAVAVHELQWDARGQLVSRTRDGRGVTWSYDADGLCTARTAPDGTRTTYARDGAGRLVGVDHPLLGQAVLELDAAGRVVGARAGGSSQTWAYADGFLVEHRASGTRTRLTRSDDGRIETIEAEGPDGTRATTYGYDEGCQLVSAATRAAGGVETVRWGYDAAGRLVSESIDGVARELVHDLAGQLVASRVDGEDVVTYFHDASGRRTAEEYADGSSRTYAWHASGWLAALTTTDRLGDTHRTDVVVDALGELARVEGTEVFLDTATPWNGAVAVGDRQVVKAGPLAGVADHDTGRWADPGWREARSAGPDPWSLPAESVPALPGVVAGVHLTPTGQLMLGAPGEALEWLANRVYDPAARGFLSTDPLDPTTGAAWAANPYSYAGNDPLHRLDPLGLHPVTDAELKAYNAHNGGFMDSAAGKWLKNNWEYVAGGLMVVGGVALMFAPFPGAQNLGMGLASAGADVIIQKATTGEVNWKQTAVAGLAGALPGAGGGLAAKAGMQGWKAAVAGGVVDGVWQGGVASGAGYLTEPGPHSMGEFWGRVGEGSLTGAATGGALGGVSHGAEAVRHLGDVKPLPDFPDPYAGVKEASHFLQEQGVPREFRKQALESFTPGTIKVDTADGSTFGLRHYGGDSPASGRYLAPTLPATRSDLALPPGNTMENLAQFQIPEGTTVISGQVGPNFGYPGGGQQMYVHDPSVLVRQQ